MASHCELVVIVVVLGVRATSSMRLDALNERPESDVANDDESRTERTIEQKYKRRRIILQSN